MGTNGRAGNRSGAAIAAAMRYAQNLTQDRLVVVILPDSGSRYLSKFYDDKWMWENGFLEAVWSEASVRDVLEAKTLQGLITACSEDRMTEVIGLMKKHDISQVPVFDQSGSLAGMVTEVDLLEYMLKGGHVHSPGETIGGIARPVQAIYPAHISLEVVLPAIMNGQIVLVAEDSRPVGILTKIDVLDYIAQAI